ncbi:hypothetical protein [Streptomyces sp. SudanB182_2057]|uniref:hypothetical protein n=1 Tax=Streptomyces sp. SudanB182_2057 TaxID=3035281 RepID=UPI003F56D3E6
MSEHQVVRVLDRRSGAREPLGYGLEDVVALATPVLLLILNDLARRATETVLDGATSRLRRWRERRATVPAVERAVPPLTTEQIADVRLRVRTECLRAGITEDRAQALADAVAVELALGTSADEGNAEPPAPAVQ